MLVRKSWATPRYAADKGLLLRDTEPDIAADGAAFASCLNGRGRGRLRSSCEKASRCLVQHGGGEPSQCRGWQQANHEKRAEEADGGTQQSPQEAPPTRNGL